MKALQLSIMLCFTSCWLLPVSDAGRLASMQVVQRLKELEPKHAEIKYQIINFVATAKFNVVHKADDFYRRVFALKEGSLTASTVLEDELLYQLDHQLAPADRSCLGMLRTIVDNNMNVAGVGFTNCVSNVESELDRALERAHKTLQLDESEIFYQRLLDVFDGENIMAGPDAILAKLQSKADAIDGYSKDYISDIFVVVETFSTALDSMRRNYEQCLNTNERILRSTYEVSRSQLTEICLGSIVP
ncbi:uncharacterized protein LOC126577531 [Anopheles aquasalis]|uniref:uncharacterized protein LOC126577531 n=1 Tax=Anopheles aquasalis TaxID=42839 RepID=UPI00215B5047|nr:uncharacterized protein LOC126577531 [Anopheles aquasalis]